MTIEGLSQTDFAVYKFLLNTFQWEPGYSGSAGLCEITSLASKSGIAPKEFACSVLELEQKGLVGTCFGVQLLHPSKAMRQKGFIPTGPGYEDWLRAVPKEVLD